MKPNPTPEDRDAAFAAFREQMARDVEDGIEGHEAAMTRMGFLFLGIFIAVIVVAAILP
ncbi:MAG: hypothetical protein RLZZ516_2788 [Cyanobacteriota bacterium]|jgi:hypothetical protein